MKASSKTIMIQGTGSGVGKSLLATALCRILHQDGYQVAPFKAINISLNSGVTSKGREIAISQITQARASGIEPDSAMNPFLIKPQRNIKPQIMIKGKLADSKQVQKYYTDKNGLWSVVKQSFDDLASRHEVIVLEGAASPAEPSFILEDIVNLKISKYAKSPVILVGDIDKGGVFASLEGTVSILKRHDPEAARLISGIIINKYQGEKKYLASACAELTKTTGIPVLGVIPFIEDHGIADEDTWFLKDKSTAKKDPVLDIAIIRTPSLQNSHDFDSLIGELGVEVRFISDAQDFGDPDLVILPGSKNTIYDLHWLKKTGLARRLLSHARKDLPALSVRQAGGRQGKAIIGICGGFQMLGKTIQDPKMVESNQQQITGLGLLDVDTIFAESKVTKQTKLKIALNTAILEGAKNLEISGYEIHLGQTTKQGKKVKLDQNGWILGTYLHDIFTNNNFRKLILTNLANKAGKKLPSPKNIFAKQDKYAALADIVRKNLDLKLLYKILNKERSSE